MSVGLTNGIIIVIYFLGMILIVGVYNLIKHYIIMRKKSVQRVYRIYLTYENGMTRAVMVKASSREVAESRALKRNPNATGVNRSQ